MSKLIFFATLLFFKAFEASTYGCPNLVTFTKANKHYFSEEIQKDAEKYGLVWTLLSRTKALGEGAFGVVGTVDGGKEPLVMKRQDPLDPRDVETISREIELSREICGVKSEDKLGEFIPCEGREIAPFKGCVEDSKSVIIFMRRAYDSLDSIELLNKYRSFDPVKRVVVILKILEKVGRLHQRKIIHSDLKSGNIVSRDPELEELELIDLGMAGRENSKFNGGSPVYLPSEVRLPPKLLTPKVDIYSLAITFLNLEGEFRNYYKDLPKQCFYPSLIYDCYKSLKKGVSKILSKGRGLRKLLPVFKKAIRFDANKRYASIEEFSKAIIKALIKIPSYKTALAKIANEENETKVEKAQDSVEKAQESSPDSQNISNLKTSPNSVKSKNSQKSDSDVRPFSWKAIAREFVNVVEPPSLFRRAINFVLCAGDNDVISPQRILQKKKVQKPIQKIEQKGILSISDNEVDQEPEAQFQPKGSLVVRNPDREFEAWVRAREIPTGTKTQVIPKASFRLQSFKERSKTPLKVQFQEEQLLGNGQGIKQRLVV